MSLFDFFKKKTPPVAEPAAESKLEAMLQLTHPDEADTARFYSLLLSENIIVLTDNTGLAPGQQILPTDTSIPIRKMPGGVIPVFTSTDRIFDNGVVKEQVDFLALKGEDLFRLTEGAGISINPYSNIYKELQPSQVSRMLHGNGQPGNHRQTTVEKDTEVQVGQPGKYPTEMISALRSFFKGTPNANAAYLGWIFDPSSGEPPHYIIGLESSSGYPELVRQAGAIATKHLQATEIVDFIQINHQGGVRDYLSEKTEPFYTRK